MSAAPVPAAARARLAARQAEVLDALLSDEVPAGFDPAGATMTTSVLLAKRRDAAVRAVPELTHLPGWRPAFRSYAAAHPAPLDGCAHDDVAAFVAALDETADPGGQWRRLHAVHDGRRRVAVVRLAGRRTVVVGLGTRTWHLTRRRWRRRALEGGTTCPQ